MNTIVTSKEAILAGCRELVSQEGLSALNMRAAARRCGIALGSLYNYFPSKSDLTLAVIESVWRDIFHLEQPCAQETSFCRMVERIFTQVKAGMIDYPHFFTTHSLGIASADKGQATQTMARYFGHMKQGLLASLVQDGAVRPGAFADGFTQPDFVDFVLGGLLNLLLSQKDDCHLLLEVIRRTIY